MSTQTPYPKPPFYPPSGHPRVFFTNKDIPRLIDNAVKPQNTNSLKIHKRNLTCNHDCRLEHAGDKSNFDAYLLSVIESFAFEYVLTGNEQYGKRAVLMMKNYLDTIFMGVDGYSYNTIGQLIFITAEVYDWCFAFVDDITKKYFYDSTIKYASMLEVGWPPVKQGAVTGHGPEGQVVRDLMCAGIAMFDEFPDIYEWVAGRFFAEFVEPREFMYRAHMFNQGSHYTSYRIQWDILSARIVDVLGASQVYGPNQQNVMYWTLYARRPDGLVLHDGDDNFSRRDPGLYMRGYVRSFMHIGNYFGDQYLKWEGMRELPHLMPEEPFANQALTCVEFLILNDPDLAGRHVRNLPLTKYFPSPKGGMIARTDWSDGYDSPAVVAEMKVNEWWFANHHHMDAGSFQIYYKGILATDTGYYQAAIDAVGSTENNGSTGYGSMHDFNYYKRTIAHNTMLVYDPDEVFIIPRGNRIANDGGQKNVQDGKEMPLLKDLLDSHEHKICDILGHEFGIDPLKPNYTYLKGDLTRAYSKKVSDFERSFMFLNLKSTTHPAALVVFDRLTTSNPMFKKTWLLHGLNKPTINGNKVVFSDTRPGYNGKLTLDTLLPAPNNTMYEVIGGEGGEFLVEGTNYHATLTPGKTHESGGYRLELSPVAKKHCDYFLNVMQVSDADTEIPDLAVIPIETDCICGAIIADRVVIFNKNKGRNTGMATFSIPIDGEFEITVADMHHGSWNIKCSGKELCSAVAKDDGGLLVFNGGKGEYTLTFVDEGVAQTSETSTATIATTDADISEIGLRVDDKFVYSHVAPKIVDGEVMVSANAVAKALGIQTKWDDFSKIMYLNTTPDDNEPIVCDEAIGHLYVKKNKRRKC